MLEQYLDINPEVAAALAAGKPVVALESTIISHGMPYPQNVETALRVEQIIRDNGAIPATIAILKGRLKVGMTPQEIEYLGKAGLDVIKTSRRDIPFIVAKQVDGATTVASTMILANMAGIKVFATGGIGGVHRGAEQTFDISADLQELATTDVAVVCAGVKSILDIGLTLEYLETQGVPVIGHQTDTLPAFYTRESEFGVDYRLDTPKQIADALKAKWAMGLKGGVVVANPIPEVHQLDRAMIDEVILDALAQMEQQGVSGKASTPFLLAKVAEKTKGSSLKANIELVFNNAKLAAEIAVEYAK
ncbi:pseudouridine-5'-phosphate glycosidase [Shewanella hanedai]|jgi:pseudouridine-5'-phosphate glycosidase|uniref:Pseudouridine-5'-phosphate glycosidase n=1 Tax=Shewanella hanedai TaxID=25 RepID=A0A553JD05_SHEHA|nr:pseudouridine-5'-phosphate glycosidase [Shewanella hanedai]TRY10334.1 pseudouridine-5'-phosphate glycosidase [Shewanella hanedai]GGJ05692.1 pseudouridine-5'-phosphate glycosidase [Shewanella hanedai]